MTPLDRSRYFEPCRDFAAPASCYTNDGTGLWCEPCTERRAALHSEPDQPDPIETFSHPFVGPVVIDGHLLTHTSDCAWPLDVEAEGRSTDVPSDGLRDALLDVPWWPVGGDYARRGRLLDVWYANHRAAIEAAARLGS